jgi:hypothetical protein
MAEQDTKKLAEIAEKESQALRKGRDIREQASKTASELIKKQEKLNQLEKDSVSNKEEIAKLQTSIEISEKKLIDLEEKSVKNQKELKKLQQEKTKLEEEAEKRFDKSEKAEKRLLDLKRQTNRDLSLSQDLMNKISSNAAGFAKEASGANKLLEQQSNILAQSELIMKSQKFLTNDYVRELEDGKNITSDISSLEKDILSQIDDAANGKYQEVDLSRQKLLLERKLAELQDENSGMTEIEKEQAIALVKQQQAALDTLESQNEQMKKMSEQAAKTLNTFNKFAELDLKGGIRSYFDLDKLKGEMKDKLGKTILEVTNAVRGEKGLAGGLKAAGAGLKGLTNMAPMFMKALGVGVLISLVGFLVDSFSKVDEEVSQLGKDLGVSKHEAMEIHHAATDLAGEMKLVGINSKEVAEGLKTAEEVMGGMDLASKFAAGDEKVKQLVKDSTVLSKEFGLGADEIKNIQDLAAMSGKSMGQLTAEASTLNKGLMTSKESLKTLAKIPPQVAASFKGSTQELIKAASKAKLLGTTLQEVQNIGMGMLEIEDSLGKEMEARVLTGKNINLDMARQYALQGDTAKLQDEILNQAGSLKEYQGMNVLAQDAMAKALGKTREDMVKMLTNAENLKNLGIDQAKMTELQEMNAEELNKELAKGGNQQYKDYVRNLAKEKESEETKKKLADAVTKLQEKMAKLVTPLIEMADKLLTVLDNTKALEPVLMTIGALLGIIATVWVGKKLVDGFSMVKNTIGGLKDGITGFFDMIKGPGSDAMKGLTEQAGDLTSQVSDAAEGVGGKASDAVGKVGTKNLTENVEELASTDVGSSKKGGGISGFFEKLDTRKLLEGAAALLVVAAALWVTAKALQEFANVNKEDMGKAALALIGLTAALLAISKIKGDLIEGAAAMVIVAAALGVLGLSLQLFKNIDIEDIGVAAASIGVLTAAIWGLAQIESSVKRLPSIMKMLGESVVEFFKPMRALVNPTLILGIGVFTLAMIGLGYAFKLLGEGIGAAAPGIKAFFDGIGGVIKTVGEAIAKVIETITTSVIRLQDIDGSKMIKAAMGIYAIAGALAAFGGGSFIGGLGDALGKFFGGDPVDKFNRFASIDSKGLLSVAMAIDKLGQAMMTFSSTMAGINLDKVDQLVEKIEKIKSAQTSAAISDLATTGMNAVTNLVGNLFGSSEQQSTQPVTAGAGGGNVAVAAGGGGTNMANVEKKLDTLISVISQAANQPTIIKFGEKFVEEIKTELNFKKAYTGTMRQGTYGKTI